MAHSGSKPGTSELNPRAIWWSRVKPRWRIYALGLASMLLTNGTEVFAPKTIQWIIDALVGLSEPGASMNPLYQALQIFLAVAVLGMLGRVFWRLTLAKMTHVVGRDIKDDIWDSLRQSKIEEISKFTLGDLMNRSIGDVNSARWIFGFTMVLTCDVVFFTVLGSVSMILIHPWLALTCLLSFLIVPPVGIYLANREFAAHDRAQDELTVLSEHVSQAVRGVRSQRASQKFGMWVRALSESAARYAEFRLNAQKVAIWGYPFFSVPTVFSYGVLLIWGPGLVVRNSISVGEFTALASYVYLLQGPLGELGDLIAEWQRGFASIKRINEIRTLEKQDLVSADDYIAGENIIECRDVRVNRQGKAILSDLDLNVAAGEWVGITARVGGGKSTLLKILSGIEAPTLGTVKINKKLVSGPVSYVPERPFIFSGSIRKNLSLHEGYSDAHLWKYLGIVQMSDQVRAMGGLDAVVGEGGVTLSGGQRQRLSLARSLLRANGLIIMDDPISAVDEATEREILTAMRREFGGHTVVMASNKRPTLNCCDRIVSMDLRHSAPNIVGDI